MYITYSRHCTLYIHIVYHDLYMYMYPSNIHVHTCTCIVMKCLLFRGLTLLINTCTCTYRNVYMFPSLSLFLSLSLSPSLPLSLSLSLSPSLPLSLSFQVPLSVDSVNPSPSVSVSGKSDDSDIVAQEATEDL